MAKRPPPGKCVHCLEFHQILTWDHVFPQAWYPTSTPKNLYKWQIPSCHECNNEYSIIERDLMIRIGLCLDPYDEASKGIHQKALRAIDPAQGKSEQDKRAREAKWLQLKSQTVVVGTVSSDTIYPNFGPEHSQSSNPAIPLLVSQKSIFKLSEKIARGLIFIENKTLIDERFDITSMPIDDETAIPIIETAIRYGKSLFNGPGITVVMATVPDDGVSSLFVIEIWGRFRIYTFVEPKD